MRIRIDKGVDNMDLSNIIGVEEAAERWGLSAGYIKNLCAQGKIKAKKGSGKWIIDGTQSAPNKKK